jgi:2-polyprenyl-6-methoxyphenol hydroxylase-like FAD-dependent oxidoreductase
MHVAIVGAGPAGLYAAYRIKRARADIEVVIVERNPRGATFGFGVVFSDQALDFLRDGDPETVAAVEPHLVRWSDITLDLPDSRIRIDGIGFAGIGRLQLLTLLEARLASVGLAPRYNTATADLSAFDHFDLVIGADGVNSVVRRSVGAEFGTTSTELTNRFVWYGTRRPFETLTQTFRRTPLGVFNAHHYRFAAGMSTFIVETDAATFEGGALGRLDDDELRRTLEHVFTDVLGGEPLISNRSVWRRFPQLSNACWHVGNRVLVGDALHTAHFSIGSGTRLALEDVQALVGALIAADWNVREALPAYEAKRRPVLDKIVRAATASAAWYEGFAEHMALSPWAFAQSYITRSGRIAPEKLRQMSPRFVRDYEAAMNERRDGAG